MAMIGGTGGRMRIVCRVIGHKNREEPFMLDGTKMRCARCGAWVMTKPSRSYLVELAKNFWGRA